MIETKVTYTLEMEGKFYIIENVPARAVRIIDGIVRNKYYGNPGALAAWYSAAHVEKAPTKKKTP